MNWLIRPPDPMWRLYRAVLIGSVVGWGVGAISLVGLVYGGDLPVEDHPEVYRLLYPMTYVFGSAIVLNHPRVLVVQLAVWNWTAQLVRRAF